MQSTFRAKRAACAIFVPPAAANTSRRAHLRICCDSLSILLLERCCHNCLSACSPPGCAVFLPTAGTHRRLAFTCSDAAAAPARSPDATFPGSRDRSERRHLRDFMPKAAAAGSFGAAGDVRSDAPEPAGGPDAAGGGDAFEGASPGSVCVPDPGPAASPPPPPPCWQLPCAAAPHLPAQCRQELPRRTPAVSSRIEPPPRHALI